MQKNFFLFAGTLCFLFSYSTFANCGSDVQVDSHVLKYADNSYSISSLDSEIFVCQIGQSIRYIKVTGNLISRGSEKFYENAWEDDTRSTVKHFYETHIKPKQQSTLEIRLHSRGGHIEAYRDIQQYFNTLNVTTKTVVEEECASACILFFMAGRERWAKAWAAFGFHTSRHEQGELTNTFLNELKKLSFPLTVFSQTEINSYLTQGGQNAGQAFSKYGETLHKHGAVTHLLP